MSSKNKSKPPRTSTSGGQKGGITAGQIKAKQVAGRDIDIVYGDKHEHIHLPKKVSLPPKFPLKPLTPVPDPGLFLDREPYLKELQAFSSDERQHLFVVPGLGGIGKTALAAHAVRKFGSDLSQVFWHPFSEEEMPSLDTLFLKFRTFFQGHGDESLSGVLENPDTTMKDKVNAVVNALGEGYWVVFDDLHVLLDQDHRIQFPGLRILFEQLLTGGYASKVLVLSRIRPSFEKQCSGLQGEKEVTGLPEVFSYELMKGLGYPSDSPELLKTVYERTEGHPEAIRLLSGLQKKRSLRHLLEDLEGWGKDFQDQLLETVVREVEEKEREVLLVTMIHRQPVTEEVVRYHLKAGSGGNMEPLNRLIDRCVLTYDQANGTYRLHGLVKEYVLSVITKEARVKAHARAAEYYDALPQVAEPVSYEQVLGEVEASYHHWMAGNYEEAAPFRLAKYFLRWGLHDLHLGMWERVKEHLKGKQLTFCYTGFGMIYQARGEYEKALEYFLRSEEIFKKLGDKAALGGSYNNIGATYLLGSEYEKALEYFERSQENGKQVGDKAG